MAEKQESATTKLMKRFNIPMTRENYQNFAFGGTPPEEGVHAELKAQLESDMPDELREKKED